MQRLLALAAATLLAGTLGQLQAGVVQVFGNVDPGTSYLEISVGQYDAGPFETGFALAGGLLLDPSVPTPEIHYTASAHFLLHAGSYQLESVTPIQFDGDTGNGWLTSSLMTSQIFDTTGTTAISQAVTAGGSGFAPGYCPIATCPDPVFSAAAVFQITTTGDYTLIQTYQATFANIAPDDTFGVGYNYGNASNITTPEPGTNALFLLGLMLIGYFLVPRIPGTMPSAAAAAPMASTILRQRTACTASRPK